MSSFAIQASCKNWAYMTILFLNNFQFHICFFNFYEDLVSSANAHAYRASQGVGGEEKKCISEASFRR